MIEYDFASIQNVFNSVMRFNYIASSVNFTVYYLIQICLRLLQFRILYRILLCVYSLVKYLRLLGTS